jgi:cell division protein FtsB
MNFFRKYINNPYFYTGFLFLIWIAFFDQNSLVEQYRLSKKLDDLESREEFYKQEIKKTSEIIKGFETDTALLEKFAREKYYMKKDKEEVFVIVRDE